MIAKENHIRLESKAADIWPEFRPLTPECAWEVGEFLTLGAELIDETPTNSETGAFTGDIFKNGNEVVLRGRSVNKAAQSESAFGQLCGLGIQCRIQVLIAVASAALDRGIQGRTQ